MNWDAVLIAGPTASGKSAAALALAERIGGALINADSMQVYAQARVLTARPSDDDMARAPHFLFGHASVHEPYSVARYLADATEAHHEVQAEKRVPIFVGGTGLYFEALTNGIAEMPKVPQPIRAAAESRREAIGAEAFFAELVARDPDSSRLKPSDTQRTLRAWEVLEATGRPLSHWQKSGGTALLSGMTLARFVLSPPRDELYRRVEHRFRAMLEAGAVEEATRLANIDPALPAAKILGRRELLAAARGETSLEEATRTAVTATRHYAKRQLTWFRNRMANWSWVEDFLPGSADAPVRTSP